MRSPSAPRFALLATLLLAWALRLFRLGDASIWWDEGLAVWAARQSLTAIAQWTSRDVHPPLYFWLLHGWRMFSGDSEWAVRALSAMLGTLTVATLWFLARGLWPTRRWLPVVAALLLATARFPLWWSQEARMYVLGGLLATGSLAFMVQLRWRPTPGARIGYFLTTVGALWTLYLLAFLLVVEGLYWLWTLRAAATRRERVRLLGQWAAWQTGVLLAFAPWLAYALPRTGSWSVQTKFDPSLFLRLYPTLLAVGASTDLARYRLPVLLIGALLGVALLGQATGRSQRNPRAPLALLVLALVVPPTIVWAVTMLPRSFGYLPRPEARYLLPFAPPAYALLAWAGATVAGAVQRGRGGEEERGRERKRTIGNDVSSPFTQHATHNTHHATRFLAGALLAVWLALAGWSNREYFAGRVRVDDYPSLAGTLRAHVQPGDGVILHTDDPWPVFTYHWPDAWAGTPHLQEATPGSVDFWLAPRWAEHEALWLVVNEDALRADPQRQFEGWLTARAAGQQEWRFGPKRLLLFARTPGRAVRLAALAPGFLPSPLPEPLAGGGLTLVGWEPPLPRLWAGESAFHALTVHPGTGEGEIEVWLEGVPGARTVATVPPGAEPMRLLLPVPLPPDTPGGTYRWQVRLGGATASLSTIQVVPALAVEQGPAAKPQHLLMAHFGEPPVARLLGYSIEPLAGGVRVTLFWQAERSLPLSYKVFVHLIGPDGRVAAQHDGEPGGGRWPTTAWRAGATIVDTHDVALPSGLVSGNYPLIVGLYDPATGTRLSPVRQDGAAQANDQAPLGTIPLPAAGADE